MKVEVLNPAEREYQVGDTDKVFIKDNPSAGLLDVRVSFIEKGKPVFRVTSEGSHYNKILRSWEIVFL
jgi:hypothetical protein